jgi:hypothetical protein
MIHRIVITASLVFALAGCTPSSSLLIRMGHPVLEDISNGLMQETDPELAREAMAANLKILDGLLIGAPESREGLVMAARGYSGYSMLFLDPEYPERARELYLRAKSYGLKALAKNAPDIASSSGSFEVFENAYETLKKEDLAAAYWTAMAWAGWINLSRTDPGAMAEFPRARLLMEFVEKRDHGYFFAGPCWFLGVYYSTLPRIVGGDPQLSREYFEKAIDLTGGHFLWGKLLYAQTYAVQTLDRSLFESLLKEVIAGDQLESPDARLLNRVAAIRARHLLNMADELF